MNFHDLDNFNLADAVKFHSRLNPRIWGSDEHLLPEVQQKLQAIAADFQEFLGVDDLKVQDLTISGSNAAYSYTPHSDIDLHLVVEMPDDPVYKELFNAKKYQYNDEHDIKIAGVPVELYVQPADQKHVSQGIYSVKNSEWNQVPQRRRAKIDDSCVQHKAADLDARIHAAIKSGDAEAINRLLDTIKTMRQTSLEKNGEFGCENIAYKLLRNRGCIDKLWKAKAAQRDRELSLEQSKKPRERMNYGMRDYWYPGTAYAGQDHPAGTETEQVDEAVGGPKIVVVGDSIAVGIAQAAGLPYEAVVGRSTRQILDAASSNPEVQGADLAIVSAGTNDYAILKGGGKNPNRKATIQNIGRIRDVLKAKQYVWILPFYETARDDVLSAIGGDAYVSLADVATTGDRLHPKNYKAVAQAALSKSLKEDITESVDPDQLKKILHRFYNSCVSKLKLENPPRLQLETTPEWSKENGSFGQYKSENNTLILATAGRHVLDILRTMAHEMTHRQQDEREPLPIDAGETGSPWEDQANAMAGRIMRQWAEEQPDMFDGVTLEESIGNETAVVTRIDPRHIRNFSAKMNTYRHTDDWSQSGVDTGDDSYWKNKNLKTNTTKGVFAGDPLFTALYATGSSAETRYVAKYGPGQPTVWFDKNDIPKLKNKQSYLTVFDAGNFEKKPSGEYFSSNPGRPIKQERITDPFAYIKKQGWKIQQTDDLPAVLEHLKAQDNARYGAEGMGFAEQTMSEASGYIPTRKQARDPRFVMALTKDVQPGAVGKEANKLGLQTDSQGHPALLTAGLQKLLREFKEQDLFEINMGGKNLRKEAAKTGALAGMEFEMIVPNTEGGGDDDEQEPDWDQDERASSPRDIRDFFYDGDFNSRRDVDRLIDSMMEDYGNWQVEAFGDRWDSDSEQFIYDYIKENMDDDEIRQLLDLEEEDPISRNEYQLAADKIASEQLDPYYEDAKNDASDSFYEDDQFEEWLADADLDTMSGIARNYDIQWPHYTSSGSGEGASVQETAESFSQAVGRPARASDSYHAYGQERPAPGKNFYVVEPDGSLEPDDPDDAGLEFVSPPLPIDEIMSDLNKVKKWADLNGCYTNKSTGLHINISVPNYDLDKLDFVKLALLMGDEYVLDLFGRSSNTYAKSAMGKVRDHVRKRPYEAKYLLDKMKGHMGELASKAIHSGSTDKYTSINTKDGHVEFRSPGGDWLGDNFSKIENTLLRFTVALSAAMDPKAYREEYLKKLYKTLNAGNDKGDLVNMFARYSAGLLPAHALKSFVRQVQAERKTQKDIKNSKDLALWKVIGSSNLPTQARGLTVKARNELEAFDQAAKEWNLNPELREKDYYEFNGWTAVWQGLVNGHRWRVSLKPELGGGVVEVTATDPIDAKKQAIQQQPNWRFVDDDAMTIERLDEPAAGTSTTAPHPEGRGRPNDPTGRLAIVNRDDPLVFAYSSGTPSRAPDYLFRFTLPDGYSQAQLRSVLAAWAARENANAADYMIVDTTQFAAPEQTAAPESGSVRWNIINRNNEIVHSFWNRNVQADANAVAREWFYNNDMANSSEGPFEVVPVAIPGSTLDLQRQRMAASQAPAPVAGVQDIEPDVEQYTSQPAQTQWEVYDRSTGNPVFRMYAATQAEAWRKGQEWVANYARMTPDQPIDPADYSVRQSTVPVSESREITKLGKLDSVLEKCIEMIHRGYESDPEKYGRVAACLIDNKNNHTYAINMPGPDGTRRHAERMAIDKHLESHGRIGPNAIMITTLSPCVDHMDERYGESCTDLLSDYGIEKCYAGWQDPTQHPAEDYPFNLKITDNADIFNTCRDIAASFLPQDMTDELSETVNPDCFDPAFNDTQHFDGLTYRATVDEEYGKPVFVIRVLDDNFQQVGLAKFKPSKKGLVSLITSFRPEYQGQGIARNIYAYVRMLGNTIVPSKNQLPPGKAMWAAWKKSGDAQHLMKDVAEAYSGPQMKFLKPGELSGSYSPQQMQAMGFKQSANGAWYIPMNTWQRLVSGGQIREESRDRREANRASLASMYARDQAERNEFEKLVHSKAGGDYTKGAQMYAQLKGRPRDSIFGDEERQNRFMKMKFDFDTFTDDDWDNYWMMAQHCDKNRDFQRQALAAIEKYQGQDHSHYHYLYDRISCGTTGTQKYGTQNGCNIDSVNENFADGRHPEDKGDSKRHGINTKASVSSLRKTAKQGGRKGQLAHWLANMKSGRAKAKRKTNEDSEFVDTIGPGLVADWDDQAGQIRYTKNNVVIPYGTAEYNAARAQHVEYRKKLKYNKLKQTTDPVYNQIRSAFEKEQQSPTKPGAAISVPQELFPQDTIKPPVKYDDPTDDDFVAEDYESMIEAVDQQTVDRFTTRANGVLETIARNADPRYQKAIRKIPIKILNGNPSNTAFALGDTLNIDAEEWYNAPDEVLLLVMGHEVGHILFGHSFRAAGTVVPIQQDQQEEYDADDFALEIAQKLGIKKIPVWTWLHRKKNDLEQAKQRQRANPNSPWPPYDDRGDRALRRRGVTLVQINTDQIDHAIQQLQHMA